VGDRVTLLLEDYRDLRGRYDKAVSIEMIEAVGHHYFDRFFKAVSDRLAADGMMLLQAITIVDQEFDRHKREVDFIKRYIFPGSCIPSVTAIARAITRKTDLRIFHLEDITAHYAKTLRRWREKFFENMEEVRRMGYSEAFIRMWEYYLSYCEAGFSERYLGDVQMLIVKPHWYASGSHLDGLLPDHRTAIHSIKRKHNLNVLQRHAVGYKTPPYP
jgi:cyclopropane-fatty-acyl-phospholipid synthase